MDTHKSVDEAKLRELYEILDRDDVNELIRNFFELCETDVLSLKDAAHNNIQDDVLRISHGLKSSSGSLGFMKLSELCRILESQARNSELVDATLQVKNVETEFNNLKNIFL